MYLVKICLNDKLLPCALKKSFMKYRYSDRINKQQIQKDKTISPVFCWNLWLLQGTLQLKKKRMCRVNPI